MAIDELERALGHSFGDRRLLFEALTHSTWIRERHDRGVDLGLGDQQRLEFLRDAFLGFIVARRVYRQFPDADEGELTEKRMKRVGITVEEWLEAVR